MFIEKLEIILKEKHLTMNKLAKAINFSQSATSQWKKGRMPQIDVFQKICKYLNVSADYLLDLDNGAPPPVLTDQEEELLEHFRQCKPDVKNSILLLADSGAEQAEREETLLNSKKTG